MLTRAGFAFAGRQLDVPLLDTALHALVNVAASSLNSGAPARRWGSAHASIVPYQALQADDGPVVVVAMNDAQFHSLCTEVLGGSC